MSEAISPQEILEHLPPGQAAKRNILVYESLASTNDRAKELIREGASSGTVVVARSQTAGRGRLGRSFFSPERDGLYMTALYRPGTRADRLMPLTAFTAVALCGAIERLVGSRPGAKWPNDILVNGKKLCGILTELSLDASGKLSGVVIGVGVNVGHSAFPRELENTATSVLLEYGAAPALPAVCAAVLERLDGAVNACLDDTRGEWMRQYREDCVTIGKRVSLCNGDTVRNGTATGIDDDAALTVIFDDGSEEAVRSGEALLQGV